ncbi:uncharacterized protein LOC123539756 [Mercenaria mercenaria]|uniref:uncharacterized protein LOC123539756 n=1 Tax=Mercenaria mercenaria TaxID=6596 RepID=UPI00234F641F|nr:uncharacterized protein LOC123539756 [Mercenaria mercenaria]
MWRMLFQFNVCLLACYLAWYFWREAVLCSNRCRCCADVHNLVNEKKSTSDQLESFKTTISKQFEETQTQMSDILGIMDRNISGYDRKWRDIFSNETETVNQRFNSSDLRLKDVVKKLNTSIEMLNDTIENVKVKSTEDLKETLTEIRANIKSIQTKTESLENSFEMYKSTVEDDIENVANQAYDRSLETITEKSNELSGKIRELTGKIDSKTSLFSTELNQLTSHLSKSKENLENKLINDAEMLRSEVNRDIANLDTIMQEMLTNSRTDIEDTKKKLSKLREDMEEQKRQNDVNIEELKKTLTDLILENVLKVQTKCRWFASEGT